MGRRKAYGNRTKTGVSPFHCFSGPDQTGTTNLVFRFFVQIRTLLPSAPPLRRVKAPNGGQDWARTSDPLRVRQLLSQLSYSPSSFQTFLGLRVFIIRVARSSPSVG